MPAGENGDGQGAETGANGAPADTDAVDCESGISGTLLKWRQVPAEGGAGGDGESTRVELALDDEAVQALAQIDGKVRTLCPLSPFLQVKEERPGR